MVLAEIADFARLSKNFRNGIKGNIKCILVVRYDEEDTFNDRVNLFRKRAAQAIKITSVTTLPQGRY